MKIAVIDDERPARKELVHQIMDAMPDSQIEEAIASGAATGKTGLRKPGQ